MEKLNGRKCDLSGTNFMLEMKLKKFLLKCCITFIQQSTLQRFRIYYTFLTKNCQYGSTITGLRYENAIYTNYVFFDTFLCTSDVLFCICVSFRCFSICLVALSINSLLWSLLRLRAVNVKLFSKIKISFVFLSRR